ncbi:hypothetical protein RIF29_22213 [Crotalaria pallida]|uniref:MADS-box domain-containing protein n=1 Tax=Crotalaria pallida TaxID=3830 RepID=A0AAN9I968_CROPI
MTRKKVKLAYINDSNARKATFKKRKKGIMKKVNELTILCGVDACAIISNPHDSQTEIWPNKEGVKKVIKRYQSALVIDKTKNMNRESFVTQRISKAQEQVDKQRKENHEKEMTRVMFNYMESRRLPQNWTVEDLNDLDNRIEKYMKDTEDKIEALS